MLTFGKAKARAKEVQDYQHISGKYNVGRLCTEHYIQCAIMQQYTTPCTYNVHTVQCSPCTMYTVFSVQHSAECLHLVGSNADLRMFANKHITSRIISKAEMKKIIRKISVGHYEPIRKNTRKLEKAESVETASDAYHLQC